MLMNLTPTQQAILVDLLVHGDDKAANIGSRTGHHRNSISRSMTALSEESLVVDKGGGVYRPTEDGVEAAQGLIHSGFNPYID
jgi:predicted transcriptional regulator